MDGCWESGVGSTIAHGNHKYGFVYVILQYGIFERIFSFDQELKIEKIAVSGAFFILIKNLWNFWYPKLTCHSIPSSSTLKPSIISHQINGL